MNPIKKSETTKTVCMLILGALTVASMSFTVGNHMPPKALKEVQQRVEKLELLAERRAEQWRQMETWMQRIEMKLDKLNNKKEGT